MRTRTREPARLARILADTSDPFRHRKLKAELDAGNPYALAYIARRGLTYRDGAIISARKD